MVAKTAAKMLKDHSGAVGQYFGSIRTPAAFLAGASFGGLFGLKPLSATARRDKPKDIENVLRTLYTLSMFVAWILALITVVVSTAALTKNLHGRYDAMAETGYLLLKTQFRFEFLLTRWGYLTSLLAFFVGVTMRILVEFQLFTTEKSKTMGVALILFNGAVFLNLISFMNANLFCFKNWWGMTYGVFAELSHRMTADKPLVAISLVMFAFAGLVAVRGVSLEEDKEEDINGSSEKKEKVS